MIPNQIVLDWFEPSPWIPQGTIHRATLLEIRSRAHLPGVLELINSTPLTSFTFYVTQTQKFVFSYIKYKYLGVFGGHFDWCVEIWALEE